MQTQNEHAVVQIQLVLYPCEVYAVELNAKTMFCTREVVIVCSLFMQ